MRGGSAQEWDQLDQQIRAVEADLEGVGLDFEEQYEMDNDIEANEDDDEVQGSDQEDGSTHCAADDIDIERNEQDERLLNELEKAFEDSDAATEDEDEDIDERTTRLPPLTVQERTDGCLMLNKVSDMFICRWDTTHIH